VKAKSASLSDSSVILEWPPAAITRPSLLVVNGTSCAQLASPFEIFAKLRCDFFEPVRDRPANVYLVLVSAEEIHILGLLLSELGAMDACHALLILGPLARDLQCPEW
jgi:hypothetical protein